MRLSDLQSKEIVNTIVKIDERTGSILSFVVEPTNKKMLSFLNRGEDKEVSWQNIERIGEDVILVRMN
mgnify:CR=1 FL=1